MEHKLKIGTYEHYKGGLYSVIGIARHSETGDELVVYRAQYGDKSLWVRPCSMFVEKVKVEGVQIPRFKYIEEDSS